jgi:hypothetical protein
LSGHKEPTPLKDAKPQLPVPTSTPPKILELSPIKQITEEIYTSPTPSRKRVQEPQDVEDEATKPFVVSNVSMLQEELSPVLVKVAPKPMGKIEIEQDDIEDDILFRSSIDDSKLPPVKKLPKVSQKNKATNGSKDDSSSSKGGALKGKILNRNYLL